MFRPPTACAEGACVRVVRGTHFQPAAMVRSAGRNGSLRKQILAGAPDAEIRAKYLLYPDYPKGE
ncbi:hypothetical protein [Tannerella forsythia]|uniref:Uncharacterized protein n=1 Tax=Tannerella forsythia TaxID=28112 RepID=A0A3P1XQB5_TANFO|nr:hypothetical protein [Tannerella forsythia]RRD60188.1 hypothetical protein EII40_07995 [Tannerella forsythia]